ncbi:MAG: hypothetical protein KME25_27360 [Symplocastrum torsivum CPER-KK1]|jgi:hypothetical protein|uniref:Uncharacterized protein n=1 Tax=Symplocastrum torsivum CPER-KK1 TaxID=450513 RepID=A0A951UCL5_9CYAN|nr:hypothetical protein [Symplocastrum torsivum CPER-KK1]
MILSAYSSPLQDRDLTTQTPDEFTSTSNRNASGSVESSYLIYAEPDHPEYRCYPTDSLLVISH